MKKLLTYGLLLTFILLGCEKIYTPKIDEVENVMVVDAQIVYGQKNNKIRLYNSLGFGNSKNNYQSITGARVSIIDSERNEYFLNEQKGGEYFLDAELQPNLQYKLRILSGNTTYESTFESVPELPEIDTIYGQLGSTVVDEGGINNVNDYRYIAGIQLYVDINNNSPHYYRFQGQKIYQYTFYVPVIEMGELVDIVHFAWGTLSPGGAFNLAAPPEVASSSEIKKHPLFFMEKEAGIGAGEVFQGWILILKQYSLTKTAYNFYKDLNSQLESDGKLFDPLYIQARNNLKCTSNPEQIVLGNFEISRCTEYRYYIDYISPEKGFVLKPIPYFYTIPPYGEQAEIPPDFWESAYKK